MTSPPTQRQLLTVLALATAIAFQVMIGVIFMRGAFERDEAAPGRAAVVAGAEHEAVGGYFCVVVAGITALAWYGLSARPRCVLAVGGVTTAGVAAYGLLGAAGAVGAAAALPLALAVAAWCRLRAPAAAALVLLLAAGGATAQTERPARGAYYFLDRLRRVDHLPELEDAHTSLASTFDRTGANADGVYFPRVEGHRNVLLDAEGPGCIHRISTGLLGRHVAGTRIRIFLDRREEPVIDTPVDAFFRPRPEVPFLAPLVSRRSYPSFFFPIPFAEHARVELVSETGAWGQFWQIVWKRYPKARIESLRLPLSIPEWIAASYVPAVWCDVEAGRVPPLGDVERHEAAWRLWPGASRELRLTGEGTIRELSAAVDPPRPAVLRGLRLQLFWDGSDVASVDAPLGYLLGNADHGHAGPARFTSLLLGNEEQRAWTRLPMPFTGGARLVLRNDGREPCTARIALDVDRSAVPAGHGRLHATWTEARAGLESGLRAGPRHIPAHEILDRRGRGKYVGLLLHVGWPSEHWWGEGDVLVWSDETGFPPSYHGTGSEEYFHSAWCRFDRMATSGWVGTRPGEVVLYTFHLNDAFDFTRRIRVVEEQLGLQLGDPLIRRLHPIWGSTALWYRDRAGAAGSRPDLAPRRTMRPRIEPVSGVFVGRAEVTMSSPTAGATVRFTRDGSEPSADSPRFEAPFVIERSTVIKARAFHPDRAPSAVVWRSLLETESRPGLPLEAAALASGFRYALHHGAPDDRGHRPPDRQGACENVARLLKSLPEGRTRLRLTGYMTVPRETTCIFDAAGREGLRLTVAGVCVLGTGPTSSEWPPEGAVVLEAGVHRVELEVACEKGQRPPKIFVRTPASERYVLPLNRLRHLR